MQNSLKKLLSEDCNKEQENSTQNRLLEKKTENTERHILDPFCWHMVGCVDKLTKRAVTGGSGHAKSKKWFAWRQNCSNSNFPSRKFRTAERCHPIQRKYNERVSCLSILDIVWLYWSCFQLGKTSIKKNYFEHCPNHLNPPTDPNSGNLVLFFRTSKFKIWKSKWGGEGDILTA